MELENAEKEHAKPASKFTPFFKICGLDAGITAKLNEYLQMLLVKEKAEEEKNSKGLLIDE